jgi:hypothetical protein
LIRCLAIDVLLLRVGFRGNMFTESLPSNRSIRHNILCPGRHLNQAPRGYISGFTASVTLLGASHFVKGTYHCCEFTFLEHFITLIEVNFGSLQPQGNENAPAMHRSADESKFK